MKIVLKWESDKEMRALFSNINNVNENDFYLLMVFHKNKKGGFERDISIEECKTILKKQNSKYNYKEVKFNERFN